MISQFMQGFEDLGFKLSLTAEGKLSISPTELTARQITLIKEHKAEIIQCLKALNNWIERVKQAQSQQEIFDILTRFRPLDWSDEQRAKMSRAYIHRLEVLEALPEVAQLMSRHLGFNQK